MTTILDTETYSEVPIKSGLHAYAENVEVMLVAYAIDDAPVQVWDRTADPEMPLDLAIALADPNETVVAHNMQFDGHVLDKVGIHIPYKQRHCTMARALCHGLPASLGALSEIFGLREDERKQKIGKSLVQLLCKPRPKTSKVRRATRHTHPVEWAQFIEYARVDVVATRELYKQLPNWNYKGFELDLWHLDQEINRDGIVVDVELAKAAIATVEREQARLASVASDLTDGDVTAATQRDKMLAHILKEYGVDLPDLTASTVERRAQDENLPEPLRELLRIRLQASTSSTAKYKALINSVGADGRLHYTMQFCGAARTGRDGHRLFQPGNMPRPTMDNEDIDLGISAIKLGIADLLYANVMELSSNAIRGSIIPPKGCKLNVSDLASIEGRVTVWIAGEEWEVQAYRDYDEGNGPDLYKLTYARAFNMDPDDVTKGDRQIGKCMVLFFGFGGGVGAFLTAVATYGIDLQKMTDAMHGLIPRHIVEQAERAWHWAGKRGLRHGLSKEVYMTCDGLKRMWRETHPKVVSLWYEVENNVRAAIDNPGQTFAYRALRFRRDGQWLRIRLPSGRYLCYPRPSVNEPKICPVCQGNKVVSYGGVMEDPRPPGNVVCPDCGGNGVEESEDDNRITFMGVNQYTRKWQQLHTYGGRLVENCLTSDTLVYTLRGVLPINKINCKDKVWDGDNWVATDGPVYKGIREVGKWLGILVTQDHLILVGDSWRPVMDLTVSATHAALRRARASARSWSFVQVQVTTAIRDAVVTAGSITKSILGNFGVSSLCAVGLVGSAKAPWRGVFTSACSLMTPFSHCGHTGTPASFLDVQTPPARRTNTTAPAELHSTVRGYATGKDFSNTPVPYWGGMTSHWISTAKTTIKATFLGIFNWSRGNKTRPTAALQSGFRIAVSGTRLLSFVGNFVRIGKASTLYDGTSPAVDQQNGLWRSTMKPEKVFDLLNCGPNSRFTVATVYGPVIVHNCVQATARDVLFASLPAVKAAGYRTALRIHDEILAYSPDTEGYSAAKLSAILSTNPPWAVGLPLAASGFDTTNRYRKE